ncbi:MAG TPA: hypothetical protein VF142_01645 [Longimicrobium sp.]
MKRWTPRSGPARRRGRREARSEPRAVPAAYDAHAGRVLVELKNGCVFGFPPGTVRGWRPPRRSSRPP